MNNPTHHQLPLKGLKFKNHPVKSAMRMLAVCLLICLHSAGLRAQCLCTPVYTVGSGASPAILNVTQAANLFPGFNTLNNMCISVVGKFDVDPGQTWTLNQVVLAFANTVSSINVRDNATLQAQSSVFRPCIATGFQGNWKGIDVESTAAISVNTCVFLEAIEGIVIKGTATFRITGSEFDICSKGLKILNTQNVLNHTVSGNLFYDCEFGIRLEKAINVNILANRYFKRSPTSIPFMTGISLITQCKNINVTGGLFTRQDRGVHSDKSERFTLNSASFEDCILGVSFKDGSHGLSILNNQFTNNRDECVLVDLQNTSPNMLGGNIEIANNNIITGGASTKTNIFLDVVPGLGSATIRNNTIQLPLVSSMTGANGIEVFRGSTTGGLFIDDNIITNLGSASPGGILINRASGICSVSRNNITSSSSVPMPYHIRVFEILNSIDIIGNNVGAGVPFNAAKGISVEASPGFIRLCCNYLTNSYSGLYIKGPLNSAQIHTTTFGNHPFAALHYDQVAATGTPQVNHGNDWSAASGMWDAFSNGSPGAAGNYVVSNINMPNFLAKVFITTGPASSWFTINNATEPTCGTSTCDGTGDGGRGGRDRSNEQNESEVHEQAFTAAVYPNPADQMLSIDFPASAGETQILLRDATGRVVAKQQVPAGAGNAQLITAALPTGLYFLEVTQNGRKVLRSKVVVGHQ